MSEKESQFIKELRMWIISGLVGMMFTGVGFYFTTRAKIDYMEQQLQEQRRLHYQDFQEVKESINGINQYLLTHNGK